MSKYIVTTAITSHKIANNMEQQNNMKNEQTGEKNEHIH